MGADPWAEGAYLLGVVLALPLVATPAACVSQHEVQQPHTKACWVAALCPEKHSSPVCAAIAAIWGGSPYLKGSLQTEMQDSIKSHHCKVHLQHSHPFNPLQDDHCQNSPSTKGILQSNTSQVGVYLLPVSLPFLLSEAPLPLSLLSHLLMTHSLL